MHITNCSVDEAVQALRANSVEPLTILRQVPISGGDTNRVYRLDLSDGSSVCLKACANRKPDFFLSEYRGLAAIRQTGTISVPEVLFLGQGAMHNNYNNSENMQYMLLQWAAGEKQGLGASLSFWRDFGTRLAALHTAPIPSISPAMPQAHFGFPTDNYIGSVPQKNTPSNSWAQFYRDCRLQPMAKLCEKYLDTKAQGQLTYLMDHLEQYMPASVQPALLHGDLWNGNFLYGLDDTAWLIDPAVYVGHNEVDLAMSELFSGFAGEFYAAYRAHVPMDPGYEDRRSLYQLYYLLVHLHLFGESYLSSVLHILRRFAP